MRAYLASLFLNNMIFHMFSTACTWVAYKASGSATSLAVIGMMQFIPVLFTFIPAGYVSDRFDKRYVVALASLASAIICSVMGYWAMSGSTVMTPLYMGVFLYSIARSFEATSTATLLPEIAPKGFLTRSVARSSSIKQVAKVAGPLLGGYLIAVSPWPGLVFFTMAVAACVSCLAIIKISPEHVMISAVTKKREPGLKKFFSGLHYIYSNKILIGAVGLDVFAGLLGGLAGILPIFATEILNSDASAVGWMRSSIATGSFVMSMYLSTYVLNRHIGRYLISSVFLLGICIVACAFARDLYSICIILCVFGLLDALSVHIRQNLIQIGSPGTVRGRVTSANQLFIVVSNQLSDVRAGLSAAAFGLVPTIILGGLGVMGVAVAWRVLFPQLVRLDTFDD